MSLTVEQIDAIAALANARFAEGASRDAVVKAVRETLSGLTVTGCLEGDVTERPFREEARWLLFLVDGSDHCWKLTADPAKASGLVIAERDEDDDA